MIINILPHEKSTRDFKSCAVPLCSVPDQGQNLGTRFGYDGENLRSLTELLQSDRKLSFHLLPPFRDLSPKVMVVALLAGSILCHLFHIMSMMYKKNLHSTG